MRRCYLPGWALAIGDLRRVAEAFIVILLTWLLLGWWFDEPILRSDGPRLFAPYVQSAIQAGPRWDEHLYRFGVVGGSAMHPAFGTTPVVQLGSLFGLSATTTGNLGVITFQLCFGYLSVVLIEALLVTWTSKARCLSVLERVLVVWCCSFAPVFGWRICAGHENLLLGLLPWVAALALWWSARASMLTMTSIAIGWFAVFFALPSLGQQTLVYSAVIGAPITAATLWSGPIPRLRHGHVLVALALVAGILCAAPRVASMVHYQLGDDSARGAAGSMFHAFGHPYLHDWLGSLTWTIEGAGYWPGAAAPHETNYPVGPLFVVAVALWPRNSSRTLLLTVVLSLLLAVALSLELEPIAGVLRSVPGIDAFRVPARAGLPIICLFPVVGLAVVLRTSRPLTMQQQLAIALGAVVLVLAMRIVTGMPRELLAWIACAALCIPRFAQGLRGAVLLVVVAAVSLASFAERVDAVPEPLAIESTPRQVRERVLASAPELVNPFVRVQIVDVPRPFEKGMAFAAGLPSLDGVWFPPRRFQAVLGALWNEELSPAEADFMVTRRPGFDILAQLYNVKYIADTNGVVTSQSPTNGPAWFASEIHFVAGAKDMVAALRAPGVDVRRALARAAWVRSNEAPLGLHSDSRCSAARVTRVATDALGQRARLDVESPSSCILVVATNYASMLRASNGSRQLIVFPVNVALTGIVIPPGKVTVELAPSRYAPWWSTLALVMGVFALGLALAGSRRRVSLRTGSAR